MNRRNWIGHITAAIGSAFAGKAFARSNPVHIADTSAPEFVPYSHHATREKILIDPFVSGVSRDDFTKRQRQFLAQRAASYAILTGTHVKSAAYRFIRKDNALLLELEADYDVVPVPGGRFAMLGDSGINNEQDHWPEEVTEESRQRAANLCGLKLKPVGVPNFGEPA